MGVEQFASQVDNSAVSKDLETTVTANSANQLDEDAVNKDLSTGDYETGEQNISGAQALNIIAKEESGNNADLIVEWTDGTGTIIATETAIQSLNSDTDDSALRVKSTHCNVKATGNSKDFNISVNAN